ncbi:hypothetical protein ACROYT_G008471 [Oculina patagonica]
MAAGKKGDMPLLKRSFSKDLDKLHLVDSKHGSNLLNGLLTMYKDGRYSDVTLKIGEKRKVPAHRVVLASFSPYFEALLGANWEDGKKKEVEMLGLDESAVSDLIEFAYSGNIDITKENVQTLLEAANYLGVEFVKKSCGDFLKGAVDDKTCLGIWHLADLFALEELKKEAKKHALRHFTEVCKKEEFLALPFNLLTDLLAEEGICVVVGGVIPCVEEREKIVLQAVFRYIEHDVENRKDYLPKLLSLVRLPTLSESYLKELTSHKLVADTCEDTVVKAQKLKMDPPEKDSTDGKWAAPRKFAKYVVTWGRAFANGGQVKPESSNHSDEKAVQDLDNDVYIKGMELWIRTWDGRPVLGGLKIFYNGDKVVMLGGNSPQSEHHQFHLEENERIVKVEARSGWMIDSLTFYSNKRDTDGKPKSYGPFGGDGGSFHSETPSGSFGFLAGVAGAVVDSQGEEGITRLQFAWRTYVLPGDPVPVQNRCKVTDAYYDYVYDEEDDDEYDDYDEDDDYDDYDDYDEYDDFDMIFDQELGIQPYMFEPLA